jgi:hypothetical protein
LVEVNKPEPRKEHSRKIKKQEESSEEPVSKEPELTAFQIAFQKAEERANKRTKVKKAKVDITREQEEIFNRTLDNRPPTL